MSKKQLLSSQTVLLRGAGRTNIEYSAGPNINITDDVISGRDWSQEMSQIVKGGVSAALSGGDNIGITYDNGINIISVTGDLYSAGPNIDITDRTISGKDWTDDIDSHIASAISGKADSSAVPEITEYSAGPNINITDHVVSGKDWSYEIGQKVGRDELVSGLSAVTEHMVETVSATSSELIDIISATSGQGGGSCPWISGGKDYGSATEQLQFGSVLPIFSSWGLCADHNHYIWMKGAYIRLPDIDPYLSSYLPLSSFSSYTASTYNWLSSVNALANSAYTTAVNNYHNKLDISAWSAFTATADVTPYSAGNGIDISDHVISFTGSEGQTYSAGDNIDITNNVISGKSWTDEIIAAVSGKQPSGDYYSASNPSGFITSAGVSSKLETSSFTAYTAAHSGDDNQAYSAGNNINITNHVVSGKDWTSAIQSAINGLSGKYVSGNNTTGFELSRYTSFNGLWDIRDVTANASSYNLYSNQYNGDAPNPDYDKHLATLSSDKLVFSSNKSGAEQVDIPSIQRWNSYSSKADKTDLNGLMSASKLEFDSSGKISAYNGSAFVGEDISTKPLSAGEYISITEDAEKVTIGLSGDVGTKYSAGDNININNYVVSGKDWTNEINSAVSSRLPTSSFTAYSAAHSGDDVTPYTGNGGIKVENHVISITGDVGKVYTGIAPIHVDNTNNEISIDHPWNLSAGNNINIVADSALNTLTINSDIADESIPLCAGPGVGVYASGDNVYISAGAGGNSITYEYATPGSAFTATGDLRVHYETSQSTPARIKAYIGEHGVGLLAPDTVTMKSLLTQDSRGSLTWQPISAIVPEDMSAHASYYAKTYTSSDAGDSCIDDYPAMDKDWTFNVINWKSAPIYYSAAQGTATLDPGYGVRIHYDVDGDWLDAEPEYPAGYIGMKYATCDMLDNRFIEYVATSAQATESGVLYIITGSN